MKKPKIVTPTPTPGAFAPTRASYITRGTSSPGASGTRSITPVVGITNPPKTGRPTLLGSTS